MIYKEIGANKWIEELQEKEGDFLDHHIYDELFALCEEFLKKIYFPQKNYEK